MLLTIDVGNTNTVLGVFDGERLHGSWRIKTDARSTADELALTFGGLLHGVPVTGICACSTVPAVLRELREMLERYYPDRATIIVEPGIRTGVPLLYDNPKEIGPDRIVNTLAAFTRYGGPAIVVDFGTSTNFDVVSSRGEFLGGALAPGIEISIDALAARGARLFKIEPARPRSAIGKSTVEALQSGVLFGFAGQVDGLVRRIAAELDAPPVVVATGGLAPLVMAECETIQHHEPDLTLLGLRMVFERNQTHPPAAPTTPGGAGEPRTAQDSDGHRTAS
ncbi:MAG: type III pantothenate kinase [Actinobacteria bacterium]|nr:type III pantothenate kinase [Actinomycetota bacterium]MBI3687481.1 type III pantothenate kinase [Actinomycetota bacterium]